MQIRNWKINSFNEKSHHLVRDALTKTDKANNLPVICCIGSDLVVGDSLGPLVGTMLKVKNAGAFVYGTLDFPLTAKEVPYLNKYLKHTHPNQEILAIDAAVGNLEDIGIIKISNEGIKPGLGVRKKLGVVGTKSIIGIVAEKSNKNHKLFSSTRLNLIYKMAERISDGIIEYLSLLETQNDFTFNFVFDQPTA